MPRISFHKITENNINIVFCRSFCTDTSCSRNMGSAVHKQKKNTPEEKNFMHAYVDFSMFCKSFKYEVNKVE